MTRGTYYAQRVIPCECGSRDAYWHGPEHGSRVYACDSCWERMQGIASLGLKACCERHTRYLGGACAKRGGR